MMLAALTAPTLRAQGTADPQPPDDDVVQSSSSSSGVSVTSHVRVNLGFGDGFAPYTEEQLELLRAEQAGVGHGSLDLGYAHHGLSFGNSAVWHGVRFNWRDQAVRDIRGLNVTLWRPGANIDGEISALSLGIWGPRADALNGVSVGLLSARARVALRGLWLGGFAVEGGELQGLGASLGVQVAHENAQGIFLSGLVNASAGGLQSEVFDDAFDDFGESLDAIDTGHHEADAEHLGESLSDAGARLATYDGGRALQGIALAGLANVRGGSVHGIQLAGFANVATGRVNGLQFAGLANVTNGGVSGVQAAGLANVLNGRLRGIELSGLAGVHNGSVDGITLNGLASVTNGRVRGISASGLANVSNGGFHGISVGGLANVANGGVRGLALGGLANVSNGSSKGLLVGGAANVSNGVSRGLFVGGLANVTNGSAKGLYLSLGGFYATELHGFGVGALKAESRRLHGAQIGLWNEVHDELEGLMIGVYNEVEGDASGAMIGVLNHVPSNPAWARWLPLFNTAF